MRMNYSRRARKAMTRMREGSGGGKLALWVTCNYLSALASLLTQGATAS